MMRFKCDECGEIFYEGEWSHWTESHGEEWVGCPRCKGSFEEYIESEDDEEE